MKMTNKSKIILFFCIVLLIPIMSFADVELVLPEYTEEYQKWLEIPEEERENYIEPQAYELVADETTEDELQTFSITTQTDDVGASSYDARFVRTDYGNVKNQGSLDACWAYTSATVFDTNYYITNKIRKTFSNLHMDYITSNNYNTNGFNRRYNSGGNFNIALAYATNGMGIAQEKNMPSSVNSSNLKNVKNDSKVSNYVALSTIRQVKNHIFNYGPVSAYTYIPSSATSSLSYFSSTNWYNNSNLAYCCSSNSLNANHAVTLVGWDDNYTNSSFSGKKGAYIALNSYGSSFGNNGLYYIFYDDCFVQDGLFGVVSTDNIDYQYLYQHDTYGPTVTANLSNTNSAYMANVFSRKETKYRENLKEVSIYAPATGYVYVYVNANGNNPNINIATRKATKYISQPGYYTIKLDSVVQLENSKFTVIVKYPTNTVATEIPIASTWTATATSNSGESYISTDGTDYTDLANSLKNQGVKYANACIKAYTDKGGIIPAKENSSDLPNYVFDYKYYADSNLDLYYAFGYNQALLRNHWYTNGIREGRKSSPVFDVKYYVQNNPDLKSMFGTNYVAAYNHFMSQGFSEYRKSSAVFDANYYRTKYGDLSNMTSMGLIRHYCQNGKNESRKASTNYNIIDYLFDANVYVTLNPDLLNAFGRNEALLKDHWYRYGIREGRIASLVFDANYYLYIYKDLSKVYGRNYVSAYQHFINNGFAEGRQGNRIFSSNYYLANNSDLKKSFSDNYLQAVNHFVTRGKLELRRTASTFYISSYMSKNSDLRRVFGQNYNSYYTHYLQFGQYEGRAGV